MPGALATTSWKRGVKDQPASSMMGRLAFISCFLLPGSKAMMGSGPSLLHSLNPTVGLGFSSRKSSISSSVGLPT